MLYPLKFSPVFKNYLWGGRKLLNLGKNLPDGIVAESWEISSHPDGISKVSNGIYEGVLFTEVLKETGESLLGASVSEEAKAKFPLLVKFIDANNDLSVQVHPDEDYVRTHNSDLYGKNEMWYIISAEPGAQLIYGLKHGTTKEAFIKAISKKKVTDCLNYISVEPGDAINIPTGLVHAIGKGIVLAEIQQNSNSTFRVYDYDRVDDKGNKRPLHIEEALEVIDFERENEQTVCKGTPVKLGGAMKTPLVKNSFFTVEHINIHQSLGEIADGSRFYIYIVVSGEGKIKYNNQSIVANLGDSILIPASLGYFTIEGSLQVLKAYI